MEAFTSGVAWDQEEESANPSPVCGVEESVEAMERVAVDMESFVGEGTELAAERIEEEEKESAHTDVDVMRRNALIA